MKTLGSSLLGRNKREKFYIWTGVGRNGKGVIITLVHNALGQYAKTFDIGHLTGKRHDAHQANPSLASLKGALFVDTQEPDNHCGKTSINTGIAKSLTGRDKMSTRLNYGNQFEFIPKFIIVMCANKLPEIDGTDQAMFNRIEVTPFNNVFVKNPSKPNEHMIDESIKDKFEMVEYKQAFMNLLISAYQAFITEDIIVPEIVKEATNVYRNENDKVKCFAEDYISKTEDLNSYIKLNDTFDAFMESEYADTKLTKQAFNKELCKQLQKSITKNTTINKKQLTNIWTGFEFKSEHNCEL